MAQLPVELTNRIAQEVYDLIIDCLSSSKLTLVSCSTVSQSWLRTCRYYLFRDVDLTPLFIRFLRSPNHAMENIATYIRNVSLGGAWNKARRDERDSVVTLLLGLEGIRSLSIMSWNWDMLSGLSQGLLFEAKGQPFQSVTRLHLLSIQFPSLQLLTSFIGGFSTLECLIFDNVKLDHHSGFPTSVPANEQYPNRPLQLNELHIIHSPIVGVLLQWLCNYDQVEAQDCFIPHIETLVLPEIFLDEAHIVGLALRTLGSFLHHVEIGFLTHNQDIDVQTLPSTVNLSHNINLRTLYIRHLTLYQFPSSKRPLPAINNFADENQPEASSHFSWLAPFLDNMPPSVSKLGFHDMWLSERDHLDLVDWPALNDIFCQPKFSGLKSLQFHVVGFGGGKNDLKNWISACLPTFKTSGNTVKISVQIF